MKITLTLEELRGLIQAPTEHNKRLDALEKKMEDVVTGIAVGATKIQTLKLQIDAMARGRDVD